MQNDLTLANVSAKLAVIGGGPAGVTAAISAARLGIDTVLVTNRPVLGGNSSSEIRVWTRGAAGAGNLYAEEMGVWGALKLENLYKNPEANVVFWDEILLDAVLRQPKLQLYLNAEISELKMDGSRITAVQGVQQSTQRRLCIEAEYFLDATGDAVLGALAGVPFEQSRDCLGSSLLYQTHKENHPVPFIAPDFAAPMEEIEKIIGSGGRILNEKMSGSDCWWFELGGNRNTIADAAQIDLSLRSLMMGVWNYVKNSGKYDADEYTLDWVGSLPGKRESRRMKTEYILKERDILDGGVFPDTAFYGGWYLDSHPSEGAFSQETNCVQPPVFVYGIPFRCLYNKAFPNLLFAGRNIGAEHGAYVSSRVMNTCALSGQAAAALVSECLCSGKAPADLSKKEISEAQAVLWREDMLLPEINPPDEDLALPAAVLTSSQNDGSPAVQSGTMSLENGGFVCYPGLPVTAFLEVEARKETEISAAFHTVSLPNRGLYGAVRSEHHWKLSCGKNILSVPADNGLFCVLVFAANADAEICTAQMQRVGFLCGRKDLAAYREPRLWYEAPICGTLYAGQNIVSGTHHVWNMPNLWQSEPGDKQPELTLIWKQPVPIQEIRLYLDPDLLMELPSSRTAHIEQSHLYTPRTGMPEHLIKDMILSAYNQNGRVLAAWEIKNNFQRLLVLQWSGGMNIAKLHIKVHGTWGNSSAHIFRIAAYDNKLTDGIQAKEFLLQERPL